MVRNVALQVSMIPRRICRERVSPTSTLNKKQKAVEDDLYNVVRKDLRKLGDCAPTP